MHFAEIESQTNESGHRVVEAASGTDALALLRTDSAEVDLLLSDYAMPQLSHTEMVIKAREFRPDLPALLITGYADADEIRQRPGDVGILSKPFSMPELVAALSQTTAASAPGG